MKLPKNYNEITLDQYFKLVELDKDKSIEKLNYVVKKLSLLSGKTESEIEAVPFNKLYSYLGLVQWTNEAPEHFSFSDVITIDGVKYNATKDLITMNPAQFIDWASLEKTGRPQNELLAIMYVEDGKSYDPSKHPYIAAKLLEQKAGDVIGLVFFWLGYSQRCAPIIAEYLEKKVVPVIADHWREIQTDKEFQSFLRTLDGSTT